MFDFSKKLVLFDRDGVLNENALVRRPEELRLLSNALRGIARLTRAGFRVGVCTNQGAIARGALDEAMLAQVHARLLFGRARVRRRYCPHCFLRQRRCGASVAQAQSGDVARSGGAFLVWRLPVCRLSAQSRR